MKKMKSLSGKKMRKKCQTTVLFGKMFSSSTLHSGGTFNQDKLGNGGNGLLSFHHI
jgi:hypothetical protein